MSVCVCLLFHTKRAFFFFCYIMPKWSDCWWAGNDTCFVLHQHVGQDLKLAEKKPSPELDTLSWNIVMKYMYIVYQYYPFCRVVMLDKHILCIVSCLVSWTNGIITRRYVSCSDPIYTTDSTWYKQLYHPNMQLMCIYSHTAKYNGGAVVFAVVW